MPAPFWTVSSLPLTVLTLKRITTFPKQKLWMKSSLSTTESMWHHLQITANLKRGIKKAKRSHKLRIKEPFKSNSDPWCMWQGIQAITGYRPTPQLHPVTLLYIMSLTTSMATLTGTTRRWPSRLCSLQTTSPSHSLPLMCMQHWASRVTTLNCSEPYWLPPTLNEDQRAHCGL